MIKNLVISGFIAIVMALPAVALADDVLYTPETIQEHSQWCWAGSSQAVLDHYGTYVEQCEIANWAWGRTDCCGNTDFYWDNTDCNNWNYMFGTSGSLQSILTNWGVNSNAIYTYLDQSVAVSEIDAGRPFVMRFGWTSGGGHFLVGYGYYQSGDYLDYMDPWIGNGYTQSLYSWVESASDHTWTHTLQITTSPVESCPMNPVRIGSTNYPSINEAYVSATSGETVIIKAFDLTENLSLSRTDIAVTKIHGGYNCDYESTDNFTRISGLTISGGAVHIANIKIR
jgi:hypothetical protein